MTLRIRETLWSAMAAGVIAVTIAGSASASENDIKYRQSVMKAVGAHTTAAAAILKNEVPHKGDLKAHARGLAELARIAGHVFPEGSDFGETSAKPEIWKKPAEFKKGLTAFQSQAAAFATAAEGSDGKAMAGAFGALTKTCKDCHDTFREKKR